VWDAGGEGLIDVLQTHGEKNVDRIGVRVLTLGLCGFKTGSKGFKKGFGGDV